eukprot:6020924-Pleurochrysis_carterae.AAC.1
MPSPRLLRHGVVTPCFTRGQVAMMSSSVVSHREGMPCRLHRPLLALNAFYHHARPRSSTLNDRIARTTCSVLETASLHVPCSERRRF